MSPVNQWDRKVMARRSLATTAATAATAATIAAVGLCVVDQSNAAQSVPNTMSRQEANGLTYSRAEARELVNPGAVDYYAKEFGVSRKEAIERLTTQGVAPNLQVPLGKALGDDLAGLYFDNEAGEWVVQVTDKQSSAAADDVLDRLGLGNYSSLDWVGYTQSDVKETYEKLRELLAEDLGGDAESIQLGVAIEGLDLRLPDTLDGEARGLVDAAIAKVGEQAGPAVAVQYVDASQLQAEKAGCNAAFQSCSTMTAGVRINVNHLGLYNTPCTAGFKGGPSDISPTTTNWYTAGHCVPQITPDASGDFYYSYTPLATSSWGFCVLNGAGTACTPTTGGVPIAGYESGLSGDAGLISANSSAIGQPKVVQWKGNQTNYHPVNGWYTASAPKGVTACYSGATSGNGCGTVVNNNASDIWYTGMLRIEGGTFCPAPGDSGGPVSGPTYNAMGLISRVEETNCPDDPSYSIVEPIHRAVAILGSEPVVTP